MTILYVICGVSCFVSIFNLLALLFMSNSLFRILVSERDLPPPPASVSRNQKETGGLLEVRETPTYDPRFRS